MHLVKGQNSQARFCKKQRKFKMFRGIASILHSDHKNGQIAKKTHFPSGLAEKLLLVLPDKIPDGLHFEFTRAGRPLTPRKAQSVFIPIPRSAAETPMVSLPDRGYQSCHRMTTICSVSPETQAQAARTEASQQLLLKTGCRFPAHSTPDASESFVRIRHLSVRTCSLKPL